MEEQQIRFDLLVQFCTHEVTCYTIKYIYIYDTYGQEIHHIVVIIMMNGMETVELIPSV